MTADETGSWTIPHDVRVTADGESLLLISPNGQYFGLDDIGVRIWRALEHDDLAATVLKISEDYEVSVDVVSSDMRSLLHDLQRVGLLQRGKS
ncbi:MAG: PqqD family protein [Trueperaceae bacterium]